MSDSNKTQAGCSLPSIGVVLTIVFVVLKLTDNIDWSWIWVLSPLWISIVLSILVFSLMVGILALFAIIKASRG